MFKNTDLIISKRLILAKIQAPKSGSIYDKDYHYLILNGAKLSELNNRISAADFLNIKNEIQQYIKTSNPKQDERVIDPFTNTPTLKRACVGIVFISSLSSVSCYIYDKSADKDYIESLQLVTKELLKQNKKPYIQMRKTDTYLNFIITCGYNSCRDEGTGTRYYLNPNLNSGNYDRYIEYISNNDTKNTRGFEY